MADKTIPLSKSYTVNGTTFDKVTLREPTYADIFGDGLGFPREAQPVKGGGVALMTYPEVVDAYAQRLIKVPGYEFIGSICAVDAKRLSEEICGFFTVPMASTAPQTFSSSASASMPEPSDE